MITFSANPVSSSDLEHKREGAGERFNGEDAAY
jgi:hypothetical protein